MTQFYSKADGKVSLKTLLILQPIEPLSLLDDLRAVFETVHYYPNTAFAPPSPNDTYATVEELAEADVLFGFQVPPHLTSFDQTPKLKLFQLLSAGYGHITSTPFFKSVPDESDFTLASASGIHVSTISEHVVATAMMLFHKLHTLVIKASKEERWVRATDELGGHFIKELRGATVGVIGYGHIGAETARLSAAFGSNIIALTRDGLRKPIGGYIVPGTGDPTGALPSKYYSSSDPAARLAFFSACDVVVNTLPSSAATQKFVGEDELKAMKGDALFVNIGRGDTVDQDKLVEALQAEKGDEEVGATGSLRIGGASLDVTDPEPLPDHHVLFTLPNTIITPHCSGLSTTYYVRAVDLLIQNVERLRVGEGALNAVRGKGE